MCGLTIAKPTQRRVVRPPAVRTAAPTRAAAFAAAAKLIRRGWPWRLRYLIVLASLAFMVEGARTLLWLPRSGWRFPMRQPRPLLVLHWAAASSFIVGVAVQKAGIVGAASPHADRAAHARRHRRVGLATLTAGVVASSTAGVLALSALHGSGPLFLAWSAVWLLAVLMSLLRAKQKRWARGGGTVCVRPTGAQ